MGRSRTVLVKAAVVVGLGTTALLQPRAVQAFAMGGGCAHCISFYSCQNPEGLCAAFGCDSNLPGCGSFGLCHYPDALLVCNADPE